MHRTFGLLTMLLVAGLVNACSAGSPGAGPAAAPSATAVQLAAAPPTVSPSAVPPATAAPPTATATVPPPTAEPAAAPGFGNVANVSALQQAGRPAPPPDPGTGKSVLVPDPTTLESPLFGDDPTELQVALTFDAGADRGHAAEILDLLASEGIKGSFGMTGRWAEENADLVRRMADEGHMLFNHTYDHDSLTGASTGNEPQTAEEVAWQLETTEAIVRDLTGYEMKPYFRTPYADYDDASLGYLADNGYYLSLWWTCDTYGWKGWTADQINDYCTVNLKPHEIILLHVGAGRADAPSGDYPALPGMIAAFREQGYAFVTVEEMLQP